MGLIFFIVLYNYKSELIRNIKDIKILVKKVRTSI